MAIPSIADALQRLKTLIDSSTPIVVMETVEETRAVRMVRSACSALNLATFEWSVASGLIRSGSTVGEVIMGTDHGPHYAPPHADFDSIEQNAKALYNSREPAQMLGNLEGRFALKTTITTFEVTGTNVEAMLREVNRILEDEKLTMHSIHLASTDGQSRLIFGVDCAREDRNVLTLRLHESNVFASVATVGTTEHE